MTRTAAATGAQPPIEDKMGERLAWAQIAMGSAVTAYGQLAESFNAATIGLSLFYMLLQWGMSYRAWQARLLFRRRQVVTAWLNIGAMLVAAWFVHAALLTALTVAADNQLLHGFSPEMLAGAMVLLPFLEPLGFWSHALLSEAIPASKGARSDDADDPGSDDRRTDGSGRPDLKVVGKGAAIAGAAGVAVAPTGDALAAPVHTQQHTERAPITRTYRGASPEQMLKAVELYAAGERNVSEIARRVGCPRTTVQKWLARAA